jgi:hypothetical protein
MVITSLRHSVYAPLPLPRAGGQAVRALLGFTAPTEVVEVANKRYAIHARELLQSDSVGGARYRTEMSSLRLLLTSNCRYEYLTASSESLIHVAMSRLMLKRLTRYYVR